MSLPNPKGIWQVRAEAILADPKKARIAATLYWLVESAMNYSPVTRKRQTREGLLWIEATGHTDRWVEDEAAR